MRVRTGLALGLFLLAATATGCGGGSDDPGVATANGSGNPSAGASSKAPAKSDQDMMLEYAKCMRANGIPQFADPEVGDGAGRMMLPDGVDPQKAKETSEKCKQYLPNGGENNRKPDDPKLVEQMKKFAECMRANGVPNFPDPSADGGAMIDQSQMGMTPDDPKFKAAQQACAQFQPNGPGTMNGLNGAPGAPGGSKA
ncbi:MAG: hypothetical protein HOV68_07620 [Streptomycetaceae bacterium]|nr:hypothetical protein [Streptomycetaceae bacterium]